jgi:hypothetical protein
VFWIGHLSFTLRFGRLDKFNPPHFIVACKAFVAVVPFYGDVSYLNLNDLAIDRVTVEANAPSRIKSLAPFDFSSGSFWVRRRADGTSDDCFGCAS